MPPFIWIELQLPSRPLDLQTTGHTPIKLLAHTVCHIYIYNAVRLGEALRKEELKKRIDQFYLVQNARLALCIFCILWRQRMLLNFTRRECAKAEEIGRNRIVSRLQKIF